MSSEKKISESKHLSETVIKGGYCIGCGVCASFENSPFEVTLDEYGKFQANNLQNHPDLVNFPVSTICPFSETSKNEDQIAKNLFAENCQYDNQIGYYSETYAGFVSEGTFREKGSSGGMGTWILTQLFEHNLIDHVIHVKENSYGEVDNLLFSFDVSSSLDEIQKGAKSRYYPVEMSQVIKKIRNIEGRYAIVGVPCFIKSIRLLSDQDPIIAQRIKFCISLVCGHFKSIRFGDMFAWQYGISPGNLKSIDFRKKIMGSDANKYGIEVQGINEKGEIIQETKLNRDLFGSLWGHGFFKYQACDYCDDVLGETADVTVGDAWLPEYVNDSNGTNIVVVRNKIIAELLEKSISEKRLHLDKITSQQVAKSQDAGLRHRRDGLSYRLYLKDQEKLWRPKKRVEAKSYIFQKKFRKIHEMRIVLAEKSHLAFNEAMKHGTFNKFKELMSPLLRKYHLLYGQTFWEKIISRLRNFLKK